MELEIENLSRMRSGTGLTEYPFEEILKMKKQMIEQNQKILELDVAEENQTCNLFSISDIATIAFFVWLLR